MPVQAGNAPQKVLYCMRRQNSLSFGKTVLDFVAGNEASIDGTDRGADQPVGLDARFVQRLINAALISSKRTAALQHEHDLAVIVVADLVDRFERGKTLGRRHGRSSGLFLLAHRTALRLPRPM